MNQKHCHLRDMIAYKPNITRTSITLHFPDEEWNCRKCCWIFVTKSWFFPLRFPSLSLSLSWFCLWHSMVIVFIRVVIELKKAHIHSWRHAQKWVRMIIIFSVAYAINYFIKHLCYVKCGAHCFWFSYLVCVYFHTMKRE